VGQRRRPERGRNFLIFAITVLLVGSVLGASGWLAWPRHTETKLAHTGIADPVPSGRVPASPLAPSASVKPSLGPARAGAGSSPSPSQTARRSADQEALGKKGAGLATTFDGVGSALTDSKVSWYYNWTSAGITAPKGVQYVPMIWGADDANSTTLASVKKLGGTLLGFNEPDLADQSNVSVETALELWPKLMATGLRLGSPAPSAGIATSESWFDQFMQGVESKGYRVDFIAAHWYGTDFTDPAAATAALKTYLQASYAKYHKPIWLTEYALIDFRGAQKYPSQAQQVAFLKTSSVMLRSLSYLERYAWFQFSPQTDGTEGTALYNEDGTQTTVGSTYRSIG
jgi:hypothetical protein